MIYQLKITLKYIKPPIWRRVEVRDSMTFYDLHRIIQNSFDWEDYHLHSFDIKRSAGTSTNHLITIGPMNQEKNQVFSFGFGYDYDEKKVILKEIFQNEKDRVLYVYDFGDNWEHDIVLEKIIPEENDIFYPRCTKVMRLAPEEDSRGESIFDDVVIKEIDGKSLMNEINQSLANEFENWLPQSFENYDDDWSELLDLAEEFKKLQPWKWMDDDQIIVVKDPETEELIYCSVMGG
ncbi:MAG: plasmid pRiA4b ORF-3 family protein, partial [Bacillus sp. (in: Bacteria)]|nr:plasmid pRiA4b ORF-3 family protein [Bacillus sp. (in: firmicutes)]